MTRKRIINLTAIAVLLVAFIVVALTVNNNSIGSYIDGDGYIMSEADVAEYIANGGDKADLSQVTSRYYATAMALFPPLIAIVLALITKEVYSSLLIGVAVGGILAANFNPIDSVYNIIDKGLISSVSSTAGIFIFLIVLGILVALVSLSGGSQAFGRWAQKHIKTKAGAVLATFALGVLVFIDDYFNCLTVGGVMRPVTDGHKVSRVKLAYIIDATAAPVCMIAPISSWAAAVSQYVADGQGLEYFIKAIPYNYYSLLTLVFIIVTAIIGFDYGKMAEFEIKAQNGDLVGNTEAEKSDDSLIEGNPHGRVFDLLIPIGILIVLCVAALLHVGGFFGGDYAGDISGAFGNTDATLGLPLGAGLALVIIIIYLIARKLVNFNTAMSAIPKGFVAMVPAIIILTLATSLKTMTTELLAAKIFVAELLQNASSMMSFLPAIIFIVACILAFATGTSWGTFGILIPIVSAGIGLDSELGIISMSACLAGAVCGDHCSPISDTTIMASAGAECNHVDHVSTQLPYAITVAVVSFFAYIITGFVRNWLISLPIAIVLMVATIFVIRAITNKKKA